MDREHLGADGFTPYEGACPWTLLWTLFSSIVIARTAGTTSTACLRMRPTARPSVRNAAARGGWAPTSTALEDRVIRA